MRRRFPIIQRGIVLLACAAIPLIASVWLLNAYAIRVSVPHTVKLLDCTNSVINFHITVPKGHAYHLELNTPEIHAAPNGTVTSSYKFSGHIRISNGATLITDFPIGSDKAWLTASGFVLTGVDFQTPSVPQLGQLIPAQKDYDIQITLDPLPPPSSSIWLYCLQSRMDMRKSIALRHSTQFIMVQRRPVRAAEIIRPNRTKDKWKGATFESRQFAILDRTSLIEFAPDFVSSLNIQ